MKYVATINDNEYLVEIIDDTKVKIDNQIYTIDFTSISDQPVFSVLINGKSYEAYIFLEEKVWQVLLKGTFYPVIVEDEREKRLRAATGGNIVLSGDTPIKAPMPGLLISVLVNDDQKVKKGDTLVILESMKMQNELRAPKDGVVSRMQVKSGESVERNQILCYVGSPN